MHLLISNLNKHSKSSEIDMIEQKFHRLLHRGILCFKEIKIQKDFASISLLNLKISFIFSIIKIWFRIHLIKFFRIK